MIGSSSTGPGLLQRLAQCHACGNLERERRGIDFVIGDVDEQHLEIDHREAGERGGAEHGFEALLNAGDEFLRHRAAERRVLGHDVFPAGSGLGEDLDAGETGPSRRSASCGYSPRWRDGDLFAIGDLQRTDIGLDPFGA
jgi:hypothetical protein